MTTANLSLIDGWGRAMMAAENVRERAERASAALSTAGVPHAVVGGNAVAEWVGRVDPEATRNTKDVDVLIRRSDFDAAKAALATVGFVYTHVMGIDTFLDGPDGRPSGGIHLLYAGEKVDAKCVTVSPDTDVAEPGLRFRVPALEALVEMKLNAYRRKDQVHLLDLIAVGLIDRAWPARYPPELAARLQTLLDDPRG